MQNWCAIIQPIILSFSQPLTRYAPNSIPPFLNLEKIIFTPSLLHFLLDIWNPGGELPYEKVRDARRKNWNLTPKGAGADLGKMLTDLLQNERRRRKLLRGMLPREIFSILTT